MIDVIIPAYRGFGETRRCLDSVLSARVAVPREVVVIDDASPEADLSAWLRDLAGTGRITLRAHERNAGFVASANEGFRLHPERDVVLLNSDTEVADGWLDRLAACAGREPGIGTVTPFSNNASIASYPRFAQPNAMPAGASTADLDALFARVNAGQCVDIPTAVGFCMFISRRCLNETGTFDQATFGRGYGEEVDFCMRASQTGWRHVLAADVFVYHEGEVSFGEGASMIREAAQRVIDARHLQFQPRLADFLAREPLRPLRRAADLERIRTDARPHLLFVAHGWGGGIDKHVRDLAAAVAKEALVLILRPMARGVACLAWLRDGEEFEAFFDTERDWNLLVELLRTLAIARVHFHHTHGLPEAVLDVPEALGVPWDVTLHDYLAICPQLHLADKKGRYCGEPDEIGCNRCLALRAPAWDHDIVGWRNRFGRLLAGAARVIAPSHDVAGRVRRYHPNLAIRVWPHPELAQEIAPVPLRVLLPGGTSAIKGLDVLEACVRDAARRALPLHFRVLGHLERPLPQWPEVPLTVAGSFPEGALDRLVAQEGGDVIFFPAQVPESFSYTLSVAMRAGLPIVATNLGALPERLAGYPSATIVAWNAPAETINDALLAAGPRRAPSHQAAAGASASMSPERYRDVYMEGVAAVPCANPAFVLPPRVFFRSADSGEPHRPLEHLFESGVLAGHAESRAALALRLGEVAVEKRRFEEAIAAYQEQVRNLEEAVEVAQDRVRVLEGSTFWRATAPLRVVAHHAKNAARAARGLGHQVRLVPARFAVARQILKDAGAVELARRIRAKIAARNAMPVGHKPYGALERAIVPLHVAASETPRVTVIVPTYGQDLHTFTCLKAVAREAGKVALEVLVMDDCAPVAARQALAAVTGVHFVRNEANLGFVRNCNRGATLAHGEFLLFLNNDAVLMEGALEALLRVFDAHPGAGAVGAKLVYPDGRLQEAGGIVWRDGSAWNYGRGDDPGKPEYNYLREVDYCSGACLLVPAALFAAAGGFDERYAPAYCEDSDLCFRLRETGHAVWYQPAAEVVHHEGVSHGTDVAEGLKRHQVENRLKLYERWKTVLSTHRLNGMLPRLERDRRAAMRVLVVDACMLTPDEDSGSVRTLRTIRVMQTMGCKVTFVADNLEYKQPYVGALREEGIEVLHWPFTRSIDGHIEDHGSDYDVIVLARYYVAVKYIDAVRRHAPRALLVLDTHDLHYLRTRRLAELEGSRALAQSAEAIYEQEIGCIRRMDVTWVVSPVEQELLARELPQARVIVTTNIHYPVAETRPFASREGIIFIGGYRHPPNVDAALFYAREVAPHLRELLPDVTTYLIGSNAPQVLRELSGPGIEFVGYVPEIEPWLNRARVSVSPLRYGAGVKGKINHSMSFGLPVVATTLSVEGMFLADGNEILVADQPRAFAEAVARLYRDEALWNRLSAAGLANVRRHFSPEAARRALAETFAFAPRRRERR